MTYNIKSYAAWAERPSLHGSYQDYVRHMEHMNKPIKSVVEREETEWTTSNQS